MVLVGGSLGGAIALDFALEYPQAVEKIVLIDAQGFIDGIGPMASLPRPLAAAGVWVLRTEQLRMVSVPNVALLSTCLSETCKNMVWQWLAHAILQQVLVSGDHAVPLCHH